MNCKLCRWYVPSAQPRVGNCFYNPPSVQFVPMTIQKPVGKGTDVKIMEEVQMLPSSARPMVAETHFCAKWSGKPAANSN